MGKGIFKQRKRGELSFYPEPGSNDKIWMDPSTGIIYNLDEARNKWLSAAKHTFEFARRGNADNMYLPLLGDLDAADDVYMAGKPLTIVSVNCSLRKLQHDEQKGFEVHINGNNIYEFYCDETSVFFDNTLNYDMESTDRIQIFVKSEGGKAQNIVCRVETAWRYE